MFIRKLRWVLLRITGIMAHELGHPLDNMNVEGLAFHDHYNKEASQTIEIVLTSMELA